MATTSDKFGEFVGVSDIYYAVVKQDGPDGYTVGENKVLAPTANVASDAVSSTSTRYYSNAPRYVTSSEGETNLTLVVSGIPTEVEAEITGKAYDSTKKRVIDDGNLNPPWIAISFRADVEGGKKFYQYLKCKAAPIPMEAETKTTDVSVKTTTLTLTAIVTDFNKFSIPNGTSMPVPGRCKRIIGDDREDPAVTDDTWFSAVQQPDIII